MSEKLTKLVVSTILNHGVKGSEIRDWHFKVREVDGVYVDVSTTVAISPKTQLTKEERVGKYLILSFVATFLAMVVLDIVGGPLPDTVLGRDLVLIATIPGFIAQLIGARFLIGRIRNRSGPMQPHPAAAGPVTAEVEEPPSVS